MSGPFLFAIAAVSLLALTPILLPLLRMQQDDDPHPFKFSDAEEDLWPVQARRA